MTQTQKRLASAVLALPIAAGLFYLSAHVHVALFEVWHAVNITSYGQHYGFDQQFQIHLFLGLPCIYIMCVFGLSKLLARDGHATSTPIS